MNSLSRPIMLPRSLLFAQKDGQEEGEYPAHWIGDKVNSSPSGKGSGRFNYVDLKKLKAGEVQNSCDLLSPQLSAVISSESQLIKNKFYSIRVRHQSGGTPFIFGRLRNYHPNNNQLIKHAKSLQLIYFRECLEPAFVEVDYTDMDLQKDGAAQSSCIKVEAWLHAEEIKYFESNKTEINSIGFDIKLNYDLGLLRSTLRISKERFPWIIMISSRWISSYDENAKEGILFLLETLVQRKNRMIINYRAQNEALSLNNHWSLVPQVDDYSFYETTDLNSTKKSLLAGFEKQLMPLPLMQLTS